MARILVAEDDSQLRNFLVRVLQRAGHHVEAAEDGADAAQVLAEEPVDLLLADVTMPGLDGIELAKQVTRRNPDVKIMFITGFAAVSLKRSHVAANGTMGATAGGAAGNLPGGSGTSSLALSKPFHLNRLIQEVGQLLYA